MRNTDQNPWVSWILCLDLEWWLVGKGLAVMLLMLVLFLKQLANKYPTQTWISTTVWKLDCFILPRHICWWGFVRIRWILSSLHGERRLLGPLLLHCISPLQNQTKKQTWVQFKRWCQYRECEQNQICHPPQNTCCCLLLHHSRPV